VVFWIVVCGWVRKGWGGGGVLGGGVVWVVGRVCVGVELWSVVGGWGGFCVVVEGKEGCFVPGQWSGEWWGGCEGGLCVVWGRERGRRIE